MMESVIDTMEGRTGTLIILYCRSDGSNRTTFFVVFDRPASLNWRVEFYYTYENDFDTSCTCMNSTV